MSYSIRFFLRKSHHVRDILTFDIDRACLTYLGRNAVWQAVRILGLNPGDEVLVPAYNCGSEIDPLIHYGLTVVPYRVSRSAQVDLKDIHRRITKKTKAVYVTHYFGFPQQLKPIMHFCQSMGLSLIEDCALALFSRNGDSFVGGEGDVSVFSFRKTAPVPDGGAVVVNNPSLQVIGQLKRPSLLNMLAILLCMVGRFIQRRLYVELKGVEKSYQFIHSVLRRLSKWIKPSTTQDKFVNNSSISWRPLGKHDYYDPKISYWSMSWISKRIIANIKPREVIAKRRGNFQHLLQAFRNIQGAKPLFKQLPEGVCPTVFPIVTDKPFQLCRGLNDHRIGAIEWWSGYHSAICWDEFPEASYLKKHVLALPIHQELSYKEMAYIAKCVQNLLDHNTMNEEVATSGK